MIKELVDKNLIVKLSFDFSLEVIKYCSKLEEIKKFTIGNQLIKSGTRIGANSCEAQNAEKKMISFINSK